MVPCRAGLSREPYARSPLFLGLAAHKHVPWGQACERGILNNREPVSGGWANPFIVPLGDRGSTPRALLCSPDDQQSSPGLLGYHAKALLFHEGDGTLLHRTESAYGIQPQKVKFTGPVEVPELELPPQAARGTIISSATLKMANPGAKRRIQEKSIV